MAGTTTLMSKVKQVLRWKKGGMSNRKIAKKVGIDKETVNTYVNKAKADPLSLDELLAMDDYLLDVRFRNGNPAYTDHRFEVFKELLPYLQEQMLNSRKNHVTLQLLWEEYAAQHPLDHYSLTQFRFHYNQNTEARKKVSTVLADMHVPGEKIYLDFAGDTLPYVDTETGEIHQAQVFVASLPATDYTFALAVPSQRTEDFVYAFIRCLHVIGGVPKIIVPDNLKSAVVKSDRFEPVINQMMDEMANHYGAVVLPARVRKPQDKANVESMVKTLYHRIYAPLRNMQFTSIDELNKAIEILTRKHNQKRMQLHGCTREERFLSIEKPELQPLPATDFEIRSHVQLKVQANCCVLLGRDSHYYSVPYKYVGQKVYVDYTRTLVKIYADGECIATHQRDYRKGRYTIVSEHMASNSQAWRSRSKDYYINKARHVMDEMATLISYIFMTSGRPEEVNYRSCDALFHLQSQTDPMVFREACLIALDKGIYSYSFISNIIKNRNVRVKEDDGAEAPKPIHSNIRGAKAFR